MNYIQSQKLTNTKVPIPINQIILLVSLRTQNILSQYKNCSNRNCLLTQMTWAQFYKAGKKKQKILLDNYVFAKQKLSRAPAITLQTHVIGAGNLNLLSNQYYIVFCVKWDFVLTGLMKLGPVVYMYT